MNADVAEAHESLRATIALAQQASRELAEANNAFLLEESAEWERVGAVIVPSFAAAELARAAALVGEPRLPGLVAARDQRRAALLAARGNLVDVVFPPADFDAVSARRKLVDDRLGDARARAKELRARPGVVEAAEAARRGSRVKDALASIVEQLASLEQSTRALETEAARLGALVARHHRARKELGVVDEQLRVVDEDALRDARALVVDALLQRPAARPRLPALGATFHRLGGIASKRDVLAALYERWVGAHGARLAELQRGGEHVMGFETVSWPASVQLRVAEATQTIDAFRRVCASVVAFTAYDKVEGDWWATFAPGVARDERGPLGADKPVDLATRAEDKLAAAWASIADDARARTQDLPPNLPAWPAPGDTEVLGAPTAPVPALPGGRRPVDHPGASNAAFDDFFGERRAGVPAGFANDDAGGVFGPAAVAPTALDNPFDARPRPATASPFALAPAVFAPGNRIGRFEIDALIGKGGMGEVYRAHLAGDAGFRRVVVLKRLAIDHKNDPVALRMFAAEAEVAARIAHPNVVQIFDVQTHGDEPFMVMEHLEGLSLLKVAQKAKAAATSFDRAVLTRCALDAARGLHAAHTMRGDDGNLAGLVHRDVSPDNLFLCSNGFTKLLDFGIARRNDLTTRTRASELKGKIPYMSPEQILGERLDCRSDLFSLGSTLYQLLSGQRPFQGENDVTTLFAVVHKAHVPVHVALDDAGDLGDIVEHLLHKRPADRPSSALEVIDALERAGPATPEAAAAFLARVWEA